VIEFARIESAAAGLGAKGNTLVGWASVFNYPILGGGLKRETTYVVPGAFARTIKEDPMPQVLLNHGRDPQVGEKPLGVPEVYEEQRKGGPNNEGGLYVEVPLDDTSYNRDIRTSLASGALRAMSIMFETERESFSEDRASRYIEQVRLFEFGPVTFPANEAAVASLHSLEDVIAQVHGGLDPERARRLHVMAQRLNGEADELAELHARIDRLTRS
jgi:HK97 family phage prohead protease